MFAISYTSRSFVERASMLNLDILSVTQSREAVSELSGWGVWDKMANCWQFATDAGDFQHIEIKVLEIWEFIIIKCTKVITMVINKILFLSSMYVTYIPEKLSASEVDEVCVVSLERNNMNSYYAVNDTWHYITNKESKNLSYLINVKRFYSSRGLQRTVNCLNTVNQQHFYGSFTIGHINPRYHHLQYL